MKTTLQLNPQDSFTLTTISREAVSGWLPIPRNAESHEEEPKAPEGEIMELVMEPSDDEIEEIDEALYDDSHLPPIPDITFQAPDLVPESVNFITQDELREMSKESTPPSDEDLKNLRRLIHHLGRLAIEVQMLRVQEQNRGTSMAEELTEAEEAMRQAVEELVQIKQHWSRA